MNVRSRSGKRFLLVLAGGVALLASSSVPIAHAGSAGVEHSKNASEARGEQPLRTAPHLVRSIPSAIDELGMTRYADLYAGVATTEDGQIQVFLTQSDEAVRSDFERTAGTSSVQFVSAKRTYGELLRIQDSLIALDGDLASLGVDVEQFWPDFEAGVDKIAVRDLTDRARQILLGSLSSHDVEIVDVAESHLDIRPTDRLHDFSPWNGGDGLTDHASGGCSSAYGVAISGHARLLTAGHRAPLNAQYRNAKCNNAGLACTPYTGTNNFVGTVMTRPGNDNGCDEEVVSASGSGDIWTGIYGSAVSTPVEDYDTSQVGDHVCNSGVYSGEVCNIVVTAKGICSHIEWNNQNGQRLVCGLVAAFKTAGDQIANQGGDSGGPVYVYHNGNVIARDIVSQSYFDRDDPDLYGRDCVYNTFTQCYNNVLFTGMAYVLPDLNAALLTDA